MFISTKFLDVDHISIQDFVKKVSHNKYSVDQIKEKVKSKFLYL